MDAMDWDASPSGRVVVTGDADACLMADRRDGIETFLQRGCQLHPIDGPRARTIRRRANTRFLKQRICALRAGQIEAMLPDKQPGEIA